MPWCRDDSVPVLQACLRMEALVKAAGISPLAQLVDADPEQVCAACEEAIRHSRVRVPRGLTLSHDGVCKWTEMAGATQGAS